MGGAGGTYKVGVGGVDELLLGAVTDGGICGRVSPELRARAGQSRGNIPGEKDPSNTWVISMIAGGCDKDARDGCSSKGGDQEAVVAGEEKGCWGRKRRAAS